MSLPIEIWKHIFLYTDPLTLTNLKRVCKWWEEIIDRTLKENNHWYMKCKEDIAQNVWPTLLEKLYPYTYINCNNIKKNAQIWIEMYRLWLKCKHLTKCKEFVESLEPIPKHRQKENITCTTVSENILALGTTEGYIYFYDINDLTKNPIYIADHLEHICNVQLMKEGTHNIAISTSISQNVKFWDIQLKELLVIKRGELICTSYTHCYTVMYNTVTVGGSKVDKIYELNVDKFVAITADKDKVSLLTRNGDYVKLCMNEGIIYNTIQVPQYHVRNYYIFKPEIIACITAFGYLGFLVHGKEWKIHNLFPIFEAIPTVILVYVHLFILGLDTGVIHIFNTENFDTLMKLDFISHKKIMLDTGPIVSLAITTYFGKEYLIAANDKRTYVINFI